MMIKHNIDIRTTVKANRRWLRKELSENLKEKALAAIEQIREEHAAEQRGEEIPSQS